MKKLFITLAAALVLALPVAVNADLLGFITGTAKTVGDFIHGQTTVTPSYCLNSWDEYKKFQDSLVIHQKERSTVRYDKIGHQYFYSRSYVDEYTSWSTNAVFPIPYVRLANWNCPDELSSGTDSYTILTTCSVSSTGASPPNGPFDISFKTVGTYVAPDCTDTNHFTREFRKTFSVMPYGSVTGRVGTPNYDLAWPFQCWAGYIYQY